MSVALTGSHTYINATKASAKDAPATYAGPSRWRDAEMAENIRAWSPMVHDTPVVCLRDPIPQ